MRRSVDEDVMRLTRYMRYLPNSTPLLDDLVGGGVVEVMVMSDEEVSDGEFASTDDTTVY